MEIDLNKLKSSNLFIEDYILLQMIYEDIEWRDYNFSEPRSDILSRLEEDNYIKTASTEVILRQEAIDLFKPSNSDIIIWIDEFRNIWPTGLNSTGQAWKGDKQDCIKKMKSFIKQYKYPKDIIIDAANRYIQFTNGSPYRMTCGNFINKQDKGSTLLAWCQNKDMKIENKSTGNKTFN
jgi:hypothetical protein